MGEWTGGKNTGSLQTLNEVIHAKSKNVAFSKGQQLLMFCGLPQRQRNVENLLVAPSGTQVWYVQTCGGKKNPAAAAPELGSTAHAFRHVPLLRREHLRTYGECSNSTGRQLPHRLSIPDGII